MSNRYRWPEAGASIEPGDDQHITLVGTSKAAARWAKARVPLIDPSNTRSHPAALEGVAVPCGGRGVAARGGDARCAGPAMVGDRIAATKYLLFKPRAG
jgi:hypothetical protein